MNELWLSFLPPGMFGLSQESSGSRWEVSSMALAEERRRKRSRSAAAESSPEAAPPRSPPTPSLDYDDSERPVKKFRAASGVVAVKPTPVVAEQKPVSLQDVPEDIVQHVLSFLSGTEDRFALQLTSRQFRRISNLPHMMKDVVVGGDPTTGRHGIIRDHDTPESASNALRPFADSGNLQATYMLGMVQSYCNQDVEAGIALLKKASQKGYTRSSYALGLVLRDSKPEEALKFMEAAASDGYLPALQEVLPARDIKAMFGEPNADELRRHLDPICLNRLLGRNYVQSVDTRDLNTSHCWNPLCGRWAFKATVNANGIAVRMRRPWGNAFYRNSAAEPAEPPVPEPLASRRSSDASSGSESSFDSDVAADFRVSRMKMCSRCCRAKYCSKLCQVYDWRSGRHKMECQFL